MSLRITYKEAHGKLVKGAIFNIIVNHNGSLTLIDLTAYADGEINCFGPVTMDHLKELFDSGRITTVLPEKGSLYVPDIGMIYNSRPSSKTGNEWFLKELENTIKILRDGENPDIQRECMECFKNYLIADSDENFRTLESVFAKLPENRRTLFEGADYKDPLVKLMNGGPKLTREQREYYLYDYFDGEWLMLR